MTVLGNILQSYLTPVSVFKKRIIYISDSELFGALVIGCLITLVSRFPDTYTQSLISDNPFIGIFSATLVAILLVLPLGLYCLSGILFVVFKIFRFKISNFQLRLSLFWSFTLVSPIGLLFSVIKLIYAPSFFELFIAGLIFIVFIVYFCLFLNICLDDKDKKVESV